MKDQLIRYVDLLFAGAPDASDIKQEILQNTLDRYDDLIGQGKSPQAAYSLSIAGIGDVSELLQQPELRSATWMQQREWWRKQRKMRLFRALLTLPSDILSMIAKNS